LKNLKVVCINGFPLSGKDTFVISCQAVAHPNTYIRHISTVDKAKEALKLLGWTGVEKTEEVRQALHTLKMISNSLFNGSKAYVEDSIQAMLHIAYRGVLFIDSREPIELAEMKKLFNATCILVSRPKSELTTVQTFADQNVLNFDYDYIVDNSGTLAELRETSKRFLRQLFEEEFQ
jgi:hypothetical protein